MKNSILSLAFLAFALLVVEPAFAQTALGNGFKCNGTTIMKGNRIVSYSKAKSNTQKTLAALRGALGGASGAKKTKIQNKIKSLKQTSIQIKSCNNGTLSGGIDPIFTSLQGVYNGSYSGYVTFVGTIDGPMSATFSIQPGTTIFMGEISFGEELGTALHNTPLMFSGDVAGIAFPAQFQIDNTFLGTVNVSITQGGQITVSSSGISFTGQLSGTTISGGLNGSYSGIPFTGSFSMTK